MPIITLTSDYGNKDYFVGALKGKILGKMNGCNIVDISHEIAHYNVFEASYIIESAYKNFPKNTVHLILINSERNNSSQYLVVQLEDQFFICSDNGVMNMLLKDKKATQIIKISNDNPIIKGSDADAFVAIANHIINGNSIIALGSRIEKEDLIDFKTFVPMLSMDTTELKGNIIYIDSFGNCVSNISKKIFDENANGRSFEIKAKNRTIHKISSHYADFKVSETKSLKDFEGDALALFNEAGYLEIAVYYGIPNATGTANSLLGLKFWDFITITFK